MAKFVEAEVVVLQPFGAGGKYDLVIEFAGKFQRIQCKCGRVREGKIKFSGHSTYLTAEGKRVRIRYGNSVDYFGIFCPENQGFYLIPSSEVSWDCQLRIEAPKNGQKLGVKWASDYELTKKISELKI
jgi:hypothetical protein